jgi:hypothetical protein
MRWAGLVARKGEGRNLNKFLEAISEGKSPPGMAKRRRENAINMELREIW